MVADAAALADGVHTDELERILTAAVRVMERVAPAAPKVSDIIAEAGTCNKSFYRHFSGKDDLILAVVRRGTVRVAGRLAVEMAQDPRPEAQVARWVSGLLAQITDPRLFTLCHATMAQMSAPAQRRLQPGASVRRRPDGDVDPDVTAPLRDLLSDPLQRMGRPDPERDADAVFDATMGTLGRYIGSGRRPPADDVEHLVGFCLGGVGATVPRDPVG